jgi:hypothetical protein
MVPDMPNRKLGSDANGKERKMIYQSNDRVTVKTDRHGPYSGQSGYVIPCPPECKAVNEDGMVWVRLDVQHVPGVPAVGFWPDEIQHVA